MPDGQRKRLRITVYIRAHKQDGALHCVGPNRTVKDVLKELRKLTGLEALKSLWTRDGYRLWDHSKIWPLVDHDSVLLACDKDTFPPATAATDDGHAELVAMKSHTEPPAVVSDGGVPPECQHARLVAARVAERKRRRAAHKAHMMAARQAFTAIPDEAALAILIALPVVDKLRLALVCRRYGSRSGAASTDGWSLAEESARLWLAECSDQERGWAPHQGSASWLGLMWRVERLRRPVAFASIGTDAALRPYPEGPLRPRLSEQGAVATVRRRYGDSAERGFLHHSTVCTAGDSMMDAGTHYVEIAVLHNGNNCPYGGLSFGVVGPGFNNATGGEAWMSGEGWLRRTGIHDGNPNPGWDSNWEGSFVEWEGLTQTDDCVLDVITAGDVVGLLLDLEQRTLSMYLNGARLGVIMAAGMKNQNGKEVGPLTGPLRWAVSKYGKMIATSSLRIERKAPPPVPSVEEVTAAVAWNEANHYVDWD